MSGGGRKRSSKWDLRDQPQFEDVDVQDDGWPGKGGRPFYHRESGHGWQSPELADGNGSKWSSLETNDLRSKHKSVFPSRESFSGSRGSHKNENGDKDSNRYVADSMAWDVDGDYGTRMSPGLDEWRQQNYSESPKNGWSRSMRDRSRSRSRSRGRSRSPVRGLRRESGFPDRSRSRSGASNQLCKDFTAGRCRRGNHCFFLHDGNQNYEDYWDSRHRKGGSSRYSTLDTRDYPSRSGRSSAQCTEFLKGRCRRGASCKFEHHGASDGFAKGSATEVSREKENDRSKRDNSIERGFEHESRRNSDIPCKFFATGYCRNGRHCRFSHHTTANVSPDKKSQDNWALDRKLDDANQLWDGPKWNDTVIVPDAAKLSEDINGNVGASLPGSTAWPMNDRLGNSMNNENTTSADPTVSVEATKSNEKDALRWKTDSAGASMGLSESRHTEKWLDDMDMSPDWNYAVPSSNHIVKEEHDHMNQRSESFKDMSLKQNVTQEVSGRINGAAAVAQSRIIEKSFFQPKHDLRDDSATTLPYDDNRKTVSSRDDLSISVSNHSFDQNVQRASVFPFSSLNTIGQSQAVIPTEPQGGILKNLQNNAPSMEGISIAKPEFRDANTSLINSGIPPSQKMVCGEQLTHLTNLSASLVQLFGSGQQLPQLYAALNSSTPSFTNLPVSASTILPDPAIGPQQHYDSIQDSVESKRPEISNNPLGVLPNTYVKTSDSGGKPEIHLKNSTPSFPGMSDGTDCKQAGGSVEEPDQKMQSATQLEPNASCEGGKGKNELGSGEIKKLQEESRKVQESDPLDGVDKEGANDGKKNKDSKGVRAFKFALVEFVKELLKPTWKEGQISKDVYKTIVKKVVDKVTGTVQGTNIPQTQEKIDNYLSFSKAKLTKLVQAYVEKAQKG